MKLFSIFVVMYSLSPPINFAIYSMENSTETQVDEDGIEICPICYDEILEPIQFCHEKHKICRACAIRYLEFLYKNKRVIICHMCRKEISRKWLHKLNIKKNFKSKEQKYLIYAISIFGPYAFLISLLMLRYLVE